MRALLVTLAALALPASAAADTITVVPEPAGVNCPAGGVKITVVPTPPAPPALPPPDQISYVCNGAAGAPGTAGAPGADGADGKDGVDGKDGQDGLDGQDGSNGANGFDGQDGSNSASGSTSTSTRQASCGKASRVITWHLPARFRGVTSATVVVGGHKRTVTITRGTVSVDLHGLACGSYPVVIQRRGIKPAVRIFTLNRSGQIGRTSVS